MTLDLDNIAGLKVFGTEGSGHQIKCWTDLNGTKALIKINSRYREASKEESVSKFLDAAGISHVQYRKIKVTYQSKERIACICKSYLSSGETSMPVYNLLGDYGYTTKASALSIFNQVILDVTSRVKIDRQALIQGILTSLTIDYIVMNPDRHFSNLEIIMQSDGKCRISPLFDFGQSFLGRDGMISQSEFIRASHKFKSLPFSRNPERNLIDIAFAKQLTNLIVSNINNNIGGLNNLNIPNFHRYVIVSRINKLMAL